MCDNISELLGWCVMLYPSNALRPLLVLAELIVPAIQLLVHDKVRRKASLLDELTINKEELYDNNLERKKTEVCMRWLGKDGQYFGCSRQGIF